MGPSQSKIMKVEKDDANIAATEKKCGDCPILRPKNGIVSSHPDDTQLSINMYPAQDSGLDFDDSDDSLHSLIKFTEGNSFDLLGISDFLSSPCADPNLQCAALQLLEHAAEWQTTNFTESVSVTFGPVAKLVLDFRDIRVRCAALDTLKLFLVSPRDTDIVKSKMPRGVVDVASRDLYSHEPLVQLASVELLDAASRSEEIFVGFAAAISRISSTLRFMPTDTQVTALRVLEISAGSNAHEIVKAVGDTFHYLSEPLSSPGTIVQIAALKVLEASARTGNPDLARAVKTILPVVKKIQSSGETDVQSAVIKVLEAFNDQQASWSVGHESDIKFDPTYTSFSVDFKIEPSPIPSVAIQKLEWYPHNSGGLGDICKYSLSTLSGSRLVAVKSIRAFDSNDKESLRKAGWRIRRQAYIWIQLSHAHILPFDGITDDFGPLPALVSLWMGNVSLSDYLKAELSRLSDRRKSELVGQVAAGLDYLHGKDIAHGDLTGTNILVDGHGNLRIADFGLSMLVAESGNLTFGSVQTGNTRWMAPEFLKYSEELESRKPTKEGDIYSFGCVTFVGWR